MNYGTLTHMVCIGESYMIIWKVNTVGYTHRWTKRLAAYEPVTIPTFEMVHGEAIGQMCQV